MSDLVKHITDAEFPAAIAARWLRVSTDADCTAAAQLTYE